MGVSDVTCLSPVAAEEPWAGPDGTGSRFSIRPTAMQATRALMVVSLVLGVLAMAIAIMGMKCTRCGGDDKTRKARIAMGGGIVFLVSGKLPKPWNVVFLNLYFHSSSLQYNSVF
uniref:Uncharacterized protein n=1 Tax=Anolis carolinensis TaxID=28377 RepID=A0A803TRV4_ANOCA